MTSVRLQEFVISMVIVMYQLSKMAEKQNLWFSYQKNISIETQNITIAASVMFEWMAVYICILTQYHSRIEPQWNKLNRS